MTYKEKLLDPRWQKKRLTIFNRDNFTCQNCYREDKTLHAHHLCYIPNRDPWDYPDYFLQTLCDSCHAQATKASKELDEPLRLMLLAGLRNTFIKGCALDVLRTYDLDDLIFFLWEWRDNPEGVITILREQHPNYLKSKELIENILNG